MKKIRQEESDEEGIETEYVEIKEKAQIKLLKRYQEGKTLGAQTLDTANTALIAPENKTDQKDCEEGKKPSNKNK